MAVYFTADPHFGHENIIKHCERPFSGVADMNAQLAKNWNARVTDKDDIYIIGDFWFRGENGEALSTLKKLKGKKHLITGNHDEKLLKMPEFRDGFVEIADILTINCEGRRAVLCHYPLCEWDGFFGGSYHIFGHIHNNKNGAFLYMKTQERALNAGVEITQYMPVTFNELIMYNDIFKSEE